MEKVKYNIIFDRKRLTSDIKKEKKAAKGLIQIEIYFNRKSRKYISTKIYVTPEQWDEKTQKINKRHSNFIRLNALINQEIQKIEAYELELLNNDQVFTPKLLDAFLKGNSSSFYRVSLNYLNVDGSIQLTSYNTIKRALDLFRDKVGDLTIKQMDYSAIKLFDNYLHNEGYKTNTIWKYHKDLKRCINALIKQGEIKENPYANFKVKTAKTRRVFLNKAEVDALYQLRYDNAPGIRKSLHRYLICCGTGLRFSDVYMLHTSQIYEAENGRGLVIDLARMKKVEHPVKVPAYEYFNGIADKLLRIYLAKAENGYLFYRRGHSSSGRNALDNKNLKLIAVDAEINKHIDFHTSRHTALTEVAAVTGNVFSVMKFAGIRNVDTAMIYIHLASESF